MGALRARGYKLDCCSCPFRRRDALLPTNPLNRALLKTCDSGVNGIAWLPSRVNLSAAVLRHPSLRAWLARRARVEAKDPRRAEVPEGEERRRT
eukprot:5183908-Prymnesium_polylepis.1